MSQKTSPRQGRSARHARRLRLVSDIVTERFCAFGEVGKARRIQWLTESPADPTLLSHLIAKHRAHLLGL